MSATHKEFAKKFSPEEFAAQFPEHAKMIEVQEKATAIAEFLMWLGKQSWFICEASEGKMHHIEYAPIQHGSVESLVMRYFGINDEIADAETRAMIDMLKKQHESER